MSPLGKNIKEIRESKGFTQADVSASTGITIKSLSQIENGVTNPRRSSLEAIAQALNCTVADLYQSDAPKPPRAPQGTTMADLAKGIANLEEILKSDISQAYAHSTPMRQALALYILTSDSAFLEPLPRDVLDILLAGPLASLEAHLDSV